MKKIIYGIFSYSKKIGKYNINFVRIANLFGWWYKFKGEVYGDYLRVKEKKFNQKICKEVFYILEQQVKDTMKKLNKKNGKEKENKKEIQERTELEN